MTTDHRWLSGTMRNGARWPEQADAVLGGSPVVLIRRLLGAAWRAMRGAEGPAYITVPVGRGLKAVLIVPPTARARRNGPRGRHGEWTLHREE